MLPCSDMCGKFIINSLVKTSSKSNSCIGNVDAALVYLQSPSGQGDAWTMECRPDEASDWPQLAGLVSFQPSAMWCEVDARPVSCAEKWCFVDRTRGVQTKQHRHHASDTTHSPSWSRAFCCRAMHSYYSMTVKLVVMWRLLFLHNMLRTYK